jgi:type IV pilus assembly protein PilC
MPIFNYKAKDSQGKNKVGRVEAVSNSQAAAVLIEKGLLVIDIKPISEGSFSTITDTFNSIKHDDLVRITRQLATMINAGLPLANALSILQDQTNPAMVRMIESILKEIESGNSFSNALEEHPKYFDRVYVNLIRAGEVGGILDKVLNRLADNMEKDKEFRAKTKGAMIYPTIVVIAMIAVFGIMMIFVIPKLTQIYTDFGAELPFATRALMDISGFFVNFWWLLTIFGFGGFTFFQKWKKTTKGAVAFDKFLFKLPIIGQLKTKIVLTEFSRTLSLLLSSGVSLINSLDVVSEAISSILYRESLKRAAKKVEKGVSLSHAIASYEVFPAILYQMIGVGEETGKLDEVLIKLSAYFQVESEHEVENLTTAIEPIIMIVLGVGVGIMVAAIILPIFNMTSQF